MTKPVVLPTPEETLAAGEATWPPAGTRHFGAWTIRHGMGGGKRVSAATADWPVTDADLPAAETAMRELSQPPLFQIRPGDEGLDALLERHGYKIVDPVNLYAVPCAELIAPIPPGTAFTMWPPLELVREIWADGGIDAQRIAVMDRAPNPKAAVLARTGDHPGGVAYVAVHGRIAMVHALHVLSEQRRQGVATRILSAAAQWAMEQGAEVLALMVTQGNHAANPLYVQLGMRVIGHYHYRLSDREE